MMTKTKIALFVGAHTDDEVVCAGSLTKLRQLGMEIHVITFANSSTLNDRRGGPTSRRILEREWNDAMDILGVRPKNRILLNYGTDRLPDRRNAVRQYVFDCVERIKPKMAFILSPHDDHQAHQVVGEESERVMKGRVNIILRCQYPWNYRSYNPNVFVGLDEDQFYTKLRVMQMYKSQAFRYKYVELFEAYTRGDGLSVKREFAEKFELVRWVL